MLFVNCIVLSLKALTDSPINLKTLAESLNLNSSEMNEAEIDIYRSIGYSFFYTKEDVADLDSVFPVEGLLQLSYSSDKPPYSPTYSLEPSTSSNPSHSTSTPSNHRRSSSMSSMLSLDSSTASSGFSSLTPSPSAIASSSSPTWASSYSPPIALESLEHPEPLCGIQTAS